MRIGRASYQSIKKIPLWEGFFMQQVSMVLLIELDIHHIFNLISDIHISREALYVLSSLDHVRAVDIWVTWPRPRSLLRVTHLEFLRVRWYYSLEIMLIVTPHHWWGVSVIHCEISHATTYFMDSKLSLPDRVIYHLKVQGVSWLNPWSRVDVGSHRVRVTLFTFRVSDSFSGVWIGLLDHLTWQNS